MPNLGDFLGHLMSEITIARMHADVEAVRIAELYASHPLLVNLPVPHFRLPNIEIDVPVVIKTMEEQQSNTGARGAPLLKEMQTKFKELYSKFLKDEEIEIRQDAKRKLDQAIDKTISSYVQPKEVGFNINQVADGLSDLVANTISAKSGPVDVSKRELIKDSLKNIARIEFLNLSKPPSRLQVLVTTPEIKAVGSNEAITRLHLKVNEESFEWTSIESEGKRKDRLVSE